MIKNLVRRMGMGAGATSRMSGEFAGSMSRMGEGIDAASRSVSDSVGSTSESMMKGIHKFITTPNKMGRMIDATTSGATRVYQGANNMVQGAMQRGSASWNNFSSSMKKEYRAGYAHSKFKNKVELNEDGSLVGVTAGEGKPRINLGSTPKSNMDFIAAGGDPRGYMKPKSSTQGGGSPVDQAVKQADDAAAPAGAGAASPPTNQPINTADPNGLFGGYSGVTQGGMGSIIGGSVLGGITSYATGGEFGQGMAMGGMGSFAIRNLHRGLGANAATLQKRASDFVGDTAGQGSFMQNRVHQMQNTASFNTLSQRKSMYMGAGLMGVIGGGNRDNHRRGFNSHRGNTF
ncbi:MAG: hypothetical protein CMQ41_07580 [Gammaproteobacteria bacterium]|nr:hypothetical protein [Gammaproteobacteria bacterium]